MYGTKDLVNQYAAQLVVSNLQFGGPDGDPRVTTFHRFLLEEWDTRVLSVFLDGKAGGHGTRGMWHVAFGTVCAGRRPTNHHALLMLEECDSERDACALASRF